MASKENKQRLTKITRKERRAAQSGDVLNTTVPEDQLRQRLRGEAGIEFDAGAVIANTAQLVGWMRLMLESESARLSPSEIVRQANDTVAVIDELLLRLDSLHPCLDAMVNEQLLSAFGKDLLSVSVDLEPWIYRVRGAISNAGSEIGGSGGKRGPKESQWSKARDKLAETLRQHSKPKMATKAAKDVAVDLLELCGHTSPRKSR